MKTILTSLARALHAILRGLAQTPDMGWFGPTPWPSELDREASVCDRR